LIRRITLRRNFVVLAAKKTEGFSGGLPAMQVTPKLKGTKRRPPQWRAPFRGDPVLPVPARRLRNSTWQGTQNVPCHGTRTVLADYPLPGRTARRAKKGRCLQRKASV